MCDASHSINGFGHWEHCAFMERTYALIKTIYYRLDIDQRIGTLCIFEGFGIFKGNIWLLYAPEF